GEGIVMADPWQADRCARSLRALAEPDRLRIMVCLRDGPKNVGAVAECLGLPVVNVSHHLGVLRQAGLVLDERRGRFVVYRLPPDVVRPGGPGERLDLGCCRLEMPEPPG